MERTAEARWAGDLGTGQGHIRTGSGACETSYNFTGRFESGLGTNPEELLGAAHAGCFSMALSAALAKAGYRPDTVRTTAKVQLEKADSGYSIARIDLVTRGRVPGIADKEFVRLAEETRKNCIIARALAAVASTLDARLES